MTTPQPTKIYSYVLRLWAESCNDAIVWRASLTQIPAGQRLYFTSLADALRYLSQNIETQALVSYE